MVHKALILRLLTLTVLALFISFSASAQEVNIDNGKALFKNHCASCHNKNMKDDLTGPALGGVQQRWEGREELLNSWIRNSQAVIASGDGYAVNLFKEWNNSVMTAFPNLTDQELIDILGYIDDVNVNGSGTVVVNGVDSDGAGTAKEESSNTFLYVTLFLILAVLAMVLGRIISNLNHMAETRAGGTPGPRQTLMEMLTSKSIIGVLIFGLVIMGGYFTINNAISLGRQQGYAPTQPIKFSHATHAGLQQIDCQYCHDGARRSKHSVIPAANTCMNCHKAIEKGSKYGTGELTKIFASVGYDPSTDKYIPNYDDMKQDEIAEIYKKWISDNFKKDNETKFADRPTRLTEAADKEANTQWEHIVESLTNDTKPNVQGAIEWTRIHNLPDHVYFNHAQHVTVGQVECQTCHGPVEQMEVLQQDAPLSMGWCINCHRQTEVKFAGNEYYNSYEKYHQELKAGTRSGVTVEDIGGLECQKCHY